MFLEQVHSLLRLCDADYIPPLARRASRHRSPPGLQLPLAAKGRWLLLQQICSQGRPARPARPASQCIM
jgi:hypothetical protein